MQGFENKYLKGEQNGHQFFLKLFTSSPCRRVANHNKLSERQGVNYHFYFDRLNLTRQELCKSGGLLLSES